MLARGDIRWANLPPPLNRRPVCIVTRDAALSSLTSVICAPLTTRVRGLAVEVPVPAHVRVPHSSVINCDNIRPIAIRDLDDKRLGGLDVASLHALDAALVHALGITTENA